MSAAVRNEDQGAVYVMAAAAARFASSNRLLPPAVISAVSYGNDQRGVNCLASSCAQNKPLRKQNRKARSLKREKKQQDLPEVLYLEGGDIHIYLIPLSPPFAYRHWHLKRKRDFLLLTSKSGRKTSISPGYE